jgi:hypothetical protein
VTVHKSGCILWDNFLLKRHCAFGIAANRR